MLFDIQSGLSLAIGAPGIWELVIIAIIVLVLFGNRLPSAAKSLGQSFSAFKKGIKEGSEDEEVQSQEKIETKV